MFSVITLLMKIVIRQLPFGVWGGAEQTRGPCDYLFSVIFRRDYFFSITFKRDYFFLRDARTEYFFAILVMSNKGKIWA